jgi:hypothetical protein
VVAHRRFVEYFIVPARRCAVRLRVFSCTSAFECSEWI